VPVGALWQSYNKFEFCWRKSSTISGIYAGIKKSRKKSELKKTEKNLKNKDFLILKERVFIYGTWAWPQFLGLVTQEPRKRACHAALGRKSSRPQGRKPKRGGKKWEKICCQGKKSVCQTTC
jgi:hypothetical protein